MTPTPHSSMILSILVVRLLNKLGLLGWPLTKTFSPRIHELLFDITGLTGTYSLIKKEEINRQSIVEINKDFLGYNITIPHLSLIHI